MENTENATHPHVKATPSDAQGGNEAAVPKGSEAERFLMQGTSQGASSLGLISRALQLLSMSQLRQLLRECSLSTSGSKHEVIQKIMIYLQTFGTIQQNIIVQFSLRLKSLLGANENQAQVAKRSNLPNDLKDSLLKTSPSILFEATDAEPLLEPIEIEPVFPSELFEIKKSDNKTLIPVFQVVPESPDKQISTIITQINGKYVQFMNPVLWRALPELTTRNGIFQILSVEPKVKVIATVRLLKRAPIDKIIEEILAKEPAPVIAPERPIIGVCPLSRKICITPARGINCKHAECFDLTYFLSFAFNNNSWICPICHQQICAEDIRVDTEYFKNIAETE